MATKACHCHCISKVINTIPPPFLKYKTSIQTPSLDRNSLLCCSSTFQVSCKKEDYPQDLKRNSRRNPRPPRRVVTISTSDGKWHGQWTRDFVFSLEEMQLADLVEAGERNTEVAVNLLIHKHAGFGFSVDGRITTAFTRKCSNCFSSYCKEINTTFDVWVLPSSKDDNSPQLPEIGGDDPSVIYVKPGCEADLDSLIQDTIRLATSVKETCSDLCEKAPPKWHCYFLNPRFHYQEGFEFSDNIRSGVTKVIERLAPNVTFAIEATREIAQFRGKIGRFGDLTAQTAVGIMNPDIGGKETYFDRRWSRLLEMKRSART